MKSVYIHIPFCNNICSYCDFTKMFYNEDLVEKYLDILENEIKENYKNEKISTVYIGGGTPSSLNIKQLKKLLEITKIFNLNKNYEYTFEANIESLDIEKIKLLKKYKVNRLSIGIETFNEKHLKFLNRFHTNEEVYEKINYAKRYFDNINIDLIYALKDETLEELKKDIELFLKLDINHISTYSLIIEPHTKLYINNVKNIDEDLDYEMYEYICKTLKENGFNHYEVSNFAKKGYESKHNLTYWNNLEYYGFGLGASGFVKNIRYTNTSNIKNYLKKIYIKEKIEMTQIENMQNEMILGLRKLKGVNINEFKKKYNIEIKDAFKIDDLLKKGKLVIKDNYISINPKYIYLSNDILINFIGEE